MQWSSLSRPISFIVRQKWCVRRCHHECNHVDVSECSHKGCFAGLYKAVEKLIEAGAAVGNSHPAGDSSKEFRFKEVR